MLLLLAAIAPQLGWRPISATPVPPQWESAFGQVVLQASLSRRAGGLTNPIQLWDEVLNTGLKILKKNCAGCHGSRGQASQWGTRNFYPSVPQFADNPSHLLAPQMFVIITDGNSLRRNGRVGWNDVRRRDLKSSNVSRTHWIAAARSRSELESDSINLAEHDGAVDSTETE